MCKLCAQLYQFTVKSTNVKTISSVQIRFVSDWLVRNCEGHKYVRTYICIYFSWICETKSHKHNKEVSLSILLYVFVHTNVAYNHTNCMENKKMQKV